MRRRPVPFAVLLSVLAAVLPGPLVLPGVVLPGFVFPGVVLPGVVLPGADAAAAAPARWSWPVATPHAIVRPFIAPASEYAAGHRGIDIAARGAVVAPADGVVHFAGVVVDRPVLSIEHPGGVLSSYEPVTSELRAGDVVTRGEVIGEVQPGHCRSPCLHFGVRIDGEYVSPLLFLGGIPHSVLLPTRPL
jgi:murein DD-endopeptidase MepM/ murein hydrolase activator NlpD